MQCIQHPEAAATARCSGCAEPCCPACVVEVAGQHWCEKCKMSAVRTTPKVESRMSLCAEAKSALVCSLVGIFVLGFVLGPVAVISGFKARSKIKDDPTLAGSGLATAAIVVGGIVCMLMLLNFARIGR